MKLTVYISILLFCSQGVMAMSIFGAGKTCVFSQVNVRLVLNGEPVKNAKVLRSWEWNKRKSDESFTDENGNVSFPPIYESSVSRFLPIELVIGQQLAVDINGEQKVFWTNSKREPDINSEYAGKNFKALCELTNEEELIEEYGSLLVTMCTLEE